MKPDRKALTRHYKETPRTAGIGAVRNSTNGKLLLVASRDVLALLNRQRAQLSLKAHPNRVLQAEWNDLGSDAFEFVVLDTLPAKDEPGYDPTDDLEVLEVLWLEKLQPYEPVGYHGAR